jgi:hypothetical protein
MNLEKRKIAFVQEFLQLQDQQTLIELEAILSRSVQPMSVAELNHRIDRSMKDAEAEWLTDNEELQSEIQTWQ